MTVPAKKMDASKDAGAPTDLFREISSHVSDALDALASAVRSDKDTASKLHIGDVDAYKPSKNKSEGHDVIDIGGSGVLSLFRPRTPKPEPKSDAGGDDWAEFTLITEAINMTHDMIESVVVTGVTTFFPDSLDDFDHDHIEDVSEHAELDHSSKEATSFGDLIHESASKIDAKTESKAVPLMPTQAKIHEVAKDSSEVKEHVKDHEKIK